MKQPGFSSLMLSAWGRYADFVLPASFAMYLWLLGWRWESLGARQPRWKQAGTAGSCVVCEIKLHLPTVLSLIGFDRRLVRLCSRSTEKDKSHRRPILPAVIWLLAYQKGRVLSQLHVEGWGVSMFQGCLPSSNMVPFPILLLLTLPTMEFVTC